MDLASLRAQQLELASSLIREDRLKNDPPDLIGGADVGFEQGGEVTRAAMVLLKYPTLELVEYKVARIATTMPYIPGFLSFRETPALMKPPGNCSRTSQICCSLTGTAFRTRAVWAWPAILACWWTSQRSVWRKNGCVASLNRSLLNPVR